MTEGWVDHNGGTAEMPPAEAEHETAAQKRARKRAELAAQIGERDGDDNERKQWQARNDEGKFAVTPSEIAALRFACPPDRVKPYKHGDPIEV